MRRLVALVGGVVLLDMLMLSALAPLLPLYARDLGLSKAQDGLLQAGYAIGIGVFALPCGWLAGRVGVRRATTTGLIGLAGASVMLGVAGSVVVADLARVLQGASGACSWAGGLAWLVAAAPVSRRGALVGTVLGMSLVGALAGPAVGVLAVQAGTAPVFCGVGAVALLLAVGAQRLPAPAPCRLPAPATLLARARDGQLLTGLGLLVLFGVTGAVVGTLVPVRLAALGAGSAAIAAAFLVAAGLEAILSPLSGRAGDRGTDRLRPVRLALPAAAAGFAALAVAPGPAMLAVAAVVTLATVGVVFTPVSALLADRAEACGLPLPFAYALLNLGWAVGSAGGAVLAGVVAQAASDATVYGAAAVLTLAVALWLRPASTRRTRRPARPAVRRVAPAR